MPRKLTEMDNEGFDLIAKEIKETHDNLGAIKKSIVEYGLTDFLAPWSDLHVTHLAAMKTFSTELLRTIVAQGIAKGLKTTSPIAKGKARSTKVIEARLAKLNSQQLPIETPLKKSVAAKRKQPKVDAPDK